MTTMDLALASAYYNYHYYHHRHYYYYIATSVAGLLNLQQLLLQLQLQLQLQLLLLSLMHQHCNLGLGISGVLKIILRLLGAGPAKFGQYFVVRVRQFLARYLRRLIYANSCSVQPHRRAQLDLG